MKILQPTQEGIMEAIEVLRNGGVIAHATETCYGLACDLTNPDALNKLFAIKKRPLDQPVSALFPSVEEAKKYVEWNAKAEELAAESLPGPLTLILPLQRDAPQKIFITADGKTPTAIGVRVSSHDLATELAEKFGKPISTTSANIHGEPNPYNVDQIAPDVDLILDSGTLPQREPSTVINLFSGNDSILRKGSIKPAGL